MRRRLPLGVQVRAGECAADASGVTNTNPVHRQSRYAELTRLGREQVLRRIVPVVSPLAAAGSAWVWAAINTSSYETGTMLADAIGVSQNRLVPEYRRAPATPRCACARARFCWVSSDVLMARGTCCLGIDPSGSG